MAGLLAGGLLSGAVLWLGSGLTTPLPVAYREALVVVVAVAGLLRETGVIPVPLPQNARQVPQDVLRGSLVRGALQFGFELGTGVRTYVSASAPYVLALAVLLLGQRIEVALLAGLGFGTGRAATPLLRYAAGTGGDWDALLGRRLALLKVGIGVVVAAAFVLFLLG